MAKKKIKKEECKKCPVKNWVWLITAIVFYMLFIRG